VNFPVLNPLTATIDTSNMFQVASHPATPATTTGGGTNPPYNAATDDILFTTPDSQLSPEQIARRNWLASQGIQYVDPNQFTNIAQTPASDTSTGDTSTGDTPQTDPNQARWDRALARLENIAAGQDPRAAQIRAQEMQRLSAEEQAQRGALEQQMSQAGVTGTEAATERAMLGTQLGAQQQNLAGQLRQQEYANMMSAASALPGQIQGRATFDLGRNQSAINAMIASGDFEGAAALFQRTFGVPLDTTRLTTEQSRADFAAGMENLTSYIASGLTFDEAFVAMQADGTVDMLDLDENDLRSLYNTLSLNTDPVYRAMHAVSDETLAALFPDMDPAEARTTFGRLHLLGIVRPGPDGNFEIDYDLLEDLFPDGGAPIGGGGGTPIPQSEQDAYDDFLDTLPTGTETQWTYQRWVAESRPATFDAFQRPVSTLPHGTNLADLFTTTNGRLPPNTTDEVLQDVGSAQLSGDEDAISNFGTSNPVLQYAMYRAIETTYRDRNGRLRVTRDGGTPEMWTDALHKVISFTPEQILQQQLEMNDVDFRQYMIDNPTATEGMTAQSWYVQSVDPAGDGSGGVVVVIKDVNTGVLRTVVVGANTNG